MNSEKRRCQTRWIWNGIACLLLFQFLLLPLGICRNVEFTQWASALLVDGELLWFVWFLLFFNLLGEILLGYSISPSESHFSKESEWGPVRVIIIRTNCWCRFRIFAPGWGCLSSVVVQIIEILGSWNSGLGFIAVQFLDRRWKLCLRSLYLRLPLWLLVIPLALALALNWGNSEPWFVSNCHYKQ